MKGYGENEDVYMSETEHHLRLLLARRVAGVIKGYFDDGEMQDNSVSPMIDFLRDTPRDIENKIFIRARNKATSH